MADSPSSPVNPFIVLCLFIVMGAGGFAVWKEFSPNAAQSGSDPTQNEGATISEALPPGTSPTTTSPAEPASPTNVAQSELSGDQVADASTPEQPVATAPDPFPDAIARAEQATTLGQLAQSRDDWQLVLNRWRQAIALMEAVPPSSPNYGQVSAKLTDYRRNQAYAESKTAQALPDNTVTGEVIVGGDTDNSASADVSEPNGTATPATEADANTAPDSDGNNAENAANDDGADNANPTNRTVYSAPIVRRSGGTPVIQVVFNDEYTVEMIVDTGASGTVITQPVAQTLGVQPTGRTNVSTASAQNVSFLLGEVDSIGVGGAALENVVVAIAGPELDIGLLGNDFFGRYDVTVRSAVVEFQER